ncbi:hypothetical protein DSO57_1030317 [Entomophthora muscae]|uniref:Uncharacterized protein n=1 Tax=Entomophthora muscae TaxID=34485 RepID=A0ACC2UAL6_9FUNG|nr:hypothetical protein DSO57_1030317 [Entomophthora muscae]
MAPPESFQPRPTVVSAAELPAQDFRYLKTEEARREYEKNYVPPNFTLKELRDSIPAHLFERSALKSFMHLFMDFIACGTLYLMATQLEGKHFLLQLLGWPVYWFVQGAFFFGIWVIAHECGHQAFSESRLLNNVVGTILHSALLVPYHAWRISHSLHHANTGHIERDQAFVPYRRSEFHKSALYEAVQESPIFILAKMAFFLVIGWPLYLIMHAGGPSYGKYTSHFHPTSPIFRPNQGNLILESDAALLVAIAIIGQCIRVYSFETVGKYYLMPYLFNNAWLVMITYLQHTDVYVPHYEKSTWNYVRGALTTVDRDFGWFLNHAMNHITDSHVVHHIFSQIPFYNAIKATPYLKEKLGKYYLYDSTPFPVAMYNAISNCNFVDDEGDVLFYRR